MTVFLASCYGKLAFDCDDLPVSDAFHDIVFVKRNCLNITFVGNEWFCGRIELNRKVDSVGARIDDSLP